MPVKAEARAATVLAAAALGAGAAALAGLGAWLDARRKTELPQVFMSATRFNKEVLQRCTVIHTPYRPTPFLTNRHIETIFAAKLRSVPKVVYKRECLLLQDGGTVALDWEQQHRGQVCWL